VGHAGDRGYLNEIKPGAGLLPADPAARSHCRAICGEMHSGFANLRSALPMNLKARHAGFKVWAGAQADIERVTAIWRECLQHYKAPYLFGATPTMADAMYAPVCTRFATYDVTLDPASAAYRDLILRWAPMLECATRPSPSPSKSMNSTSSSSRGKLRSTNWRKP
jgi:glutathione S-transferase